MVLTLRKISLSNFSVVSGISNRLYGKKRKPKTPKFNRKVSKSKNHPVLTTYCCQKTAKKQSICYLSTILALTTRKATIKMIVNNSKCSLITLSNTLRVVSWKHLILAPILAISLNTSKNELLKIFCGFRVFEYAPWQKMKTRKYRKSMESFPNKKTLIANGIHY